MQKNVIIKSLEIYHPEIKVENQFFIDHFAKAGVEIEGLMSHLGRKERYYCTEGENALTMAAEASRKAIVAAGLSPEDIDIILFVSETPEYLMPTNALKLNNLLGAKNAHLTFDMNDNCIGMITALDMISRFMKSSNKRHALIVGSVFTPIMIRHDCPVSYPNTADGSAAIILSCEEGDAPRGFIDAEYYANSNNHALMMTPACGMSKMFDHSIADDDKKLVWIPHDVSFFSDDWKRLILFLLERNKLSVTDIDHYLFSQFSKGDAITTLEKLGLGIEKSTFVGEKYGYTGCSSPFFALHEALQQKKVGKDSTLLFCSVGAGYTMASALFKL